jgi:hypothetical protein
MSFAWNKKPGAPGSAFASIQFPFAADRFSPADVNGLGYLFPGFIVDGRSDLCRKFSGDLRHTVIGAGVLSAFLHDFLLGFTASFKITVHANISATDDLGHMGSPFAEKYRLSERSGSIHVIQNPASTRSELNPQTDKVNVGQSRLAAPPRVGGAALVQLLALSITSLQARAPRKSQ